MALEPPTGLSPSRVSSFPDCALAFRFSAIDRLPEPPSLPAIRGTLVHAALERLFALEPAERTVDRAAACLAEAHAAMQGDPEYLGLDLDEEAEATFLGRGPGSAGRTTSSSRTRPRITPIGLELRLEAPLGDLNLRGIIDRLELDDDGGLVVTDYKTGAAPRQQYEQGRLGGVHFYSLPVRAALRGAPGQGPAALPGRPGGHHHRAHRAVHPGPAPQARRPSGRPSSGPASARTSGRDPSGCATGARSRPTARRSGGDPPAPTPSGRGRRQRGDRGATPIDLRPVPVPG